MAGEEEDATGSINKEEKILVNRSDDEKHRPIIFGDQFRLSAYAAQYTGRTKINRLLLIADKCEGTRMEFEALRMAFWEGFRGSDTRLFEEVVAKLLRLDPAYTSTDWVKKVDKWAVLREQNLKYDLNAHVTTYYKESLSERTLNGERVRKVYNNLGDFYMSRGQFDEAYTTYYNLRTYCTTADQRMEKFILVQFELGCFDDVACYASDIMDREVGLSTITIAKLRCLAGLALLRRREYRRAAHQFVKTSPELIEKSYSEVIAVPRDIAVYGGICAVGCFCRGELEKHVNKNSDFQEFLKLVPQIRELINNFCSGEYTSCMEILGKLKPHLLLDFYLHNQVEYLFAEIRKKAIINYSVQHYTLDLKIMENVFMMSIPELVKVLKPLIYRGEIHDRIEYSHNKVEE